MRTITTLKHWVWEKLPNPCGYRYTGETSNGNMIELYTVISPDNHGDYLLVEWSKENALRLNKGEEAK